MSPLRLPWLLAAMTLCACTTTPAPRPGDPAMPTPPTATPAATAAITRPTAAGAEYDGVVLPAGSAATAAVLPAALRLEPARVLGPANPLLLGLTSDGRACDDQFLRPDGSPDPDMQALLPTIPFTFMRIAQWSHGTHWADGTGPLAARPPVRFQAWEKPAPNRCGIGELAAAIRAAHPQARFTVAIDIERSEPDDAAHLAEFLLGDGSGEWSRQRVEAGIAAPIPVAAWELGNETDWRDPPKRLDPARYVALCRTAIAAVRRVDPRARFAPHVATAPWAWKDRFKQDWKDWHRTVLRELGGDIAYLAIHPYYYGFPTATVERYFDQVRADVAELAPGRGITLFVSEHGLWPNAKAGEKWETSWWQTHGMPGCLGTAQFLLRCAARGDVGLASYHSLSSGPWGLVYRGKQGGRLWSTGMAEVFRLLGPVLAEGELVAASLSGARSDPAADDCSLTALAVRRADGALLLALVNREPTARRSLELELPAGYVLVERCELNAASAEARNSEQERAITITRDTRRGDAPARLELPAHSATTLRLERR